MREYLYTQILIKYNVAIEIPKTILKLMMFECYVDDNKT